MNIGIVTFHRALNYGAVIQGWALQQYLKSLGHTVQFIEYHYKFEDSEKWRNVTSLKQAILVIRRYIVQRAFDRFRRKNLLVSRTYFDISDLKSSPPHVDILICGSDQIWNPEHAKFHSDEQASWLQFGDPSVKRIAYAASFGVQSLDAHWLARWSLYAKSLDFVGVREDSAQMIMEQLEKKCWWTPDPTQLLLSSDYLPLFQKIKIKKTKYLYLFRLGDRIKTIGQEVAQRLNIELQTLNSQTLTNRFQGRSPERWLAEISQSSFMITDSYHAMSFALVFNRPFVVFLDIKSSNRNSRMLSLLTRVGLESRAIIDLNPEVIFEILNTPIHWDVVNAKLAAFREDGRIFLQMAIGAPKPA